MDNTALLSALENNLNPGATSNYEEGIRFFNAPGNERGKEFVKLFFARYYLECIVNKNVGDVPILDSIGSMISRFEGELKSEKTKDGEEPEELL